MPYLIHINHPLYWISLLVRLSKRKVIDIYIYTFTFHNNNCISIDSVYMEWVDTLKDCIVQGDIIQAVPSRRLSKATTLHPFNAYRQLRSLNPSPYMFYLNFNNFQIVGASPELLCKGSIIHTLYIDNPFS